MALLGITILGFRFSGSEWLGIVLLALVIVTGVWFLLTRRRG